MQFSACNRILITYILVPNKKGSYMPRKTINLSFDELVAEVRRRQKLLPRLQQKAARLEAELAEVRNEIRTLGGVVPVAKATGRKALAQRKRAQNKMSLAQAILGVLSKDEPKSVQQIIKDVQKAGYKTTSRNFSTIIHQTLAREKKRIAKVGRGLYQLKG